MLRPSRALGLSALGFSLLACGGSTTLDGGSGGADAGSPGSGGTRASGGSAGSAGAKPMGGGGGAAGAGGQSCTFIPRPPGCCPPATSSGCCPGDGACCACVGNRCTNFWNGGDPVIQAFSSCVCASSKCAGPCLGSCNGQGISLACSQCTQEIEQSECKAEFEACGGILPKPDAG